MRLEFIKGHMGGNTIVILDGRQVPPERALDLSLKVLGENYLYSHEAGIISPGGEGVDLDVRIVGRASGKFLTACGGLTQVLGKALVQTGWGNRFGLDLQRRKTVMLGTPGCVTPIRVFPEREAFTTETDMTKFVEEIYGLGVEPLTLSGIDAWKIGKFLVIHADELRRALPDADVDNLDDVSRKTTVQMQEEFVSSFQDAAFDVAVYDHYPVRNQCSFRVLFPHSILKGLIEPSCGTGSIAACVAAVYDGYVATAEFETQDSEMTMTFDLESGGGASLGGPDTSRVEVTLESGVITKATFSHNNVQITCAGHLFLKSQEACKNNVPNVVPPSSTSRE
jgi:hypothetical protein